MKTLHSFFLIGALTLVLLSGCDYGETGNADITDTYYPGDERFEERMAFFNGLWYSGYAGIGLLDGYRIRDWSSMTEDEQAKISSVFDSCGIDKLKTYSSKRSPQENDYIVFYDDTLYAQEDDDSEISYNEWGMNYMGLVRAVNIFNGDINRGAIIIEYFEGSDPEWLYKSTADDQISSQGLQPGEKPFFGIFYRVIEDNVIQFANAINLAAMYAGELYHTEKKTLEEAVETNTVENEAEFISWGTVIPYNRQ